MNKALHYPSFSLGERVSAFGEPMTLKENLEGQSKGNVSAESVRGVSERGGRCIWKRGGSRLHQPWNYRDIE